MPMYRIRAYRRQMVEVLVYAKDDEWACDQAIDLPQSAWDVIETNDVDDFFSVCEMPGEPEFWE